MNEYVRMRLQRKRLSGNDTTHSAIVRYCTNEDLTLIDKYIKQREKLWYDYSNAALVDVEQIDIEKIVERLMLKCGFIKK